MNMNLCISEPHFVLQISQPPNIAQKWFFTQNLHMGLSFQKKKLRDALDRGEVEQVLAV